MSEANSFIQIFPEISEYFLENLLKFFLSTRYLLFCSLIYLFNIRILLVYKALTFLTVDNKPPTLTVTDKIVSIIGKEVKVPIEYEDLDEGQTVTIEIDTTNPHAVLNDDKTVLSWTLNDIKLNKLT